MDELVLMKLYTVIVQNMRMCMIENNPAPKNNKGEFKGDNELCRMRGILCDLTHSSR